MTRNEGSLRGLVINVQDCDINVSKFEFELCFKFTLDKNPWERYKLPDSFAMI